MRGNAYVDLSQFMMGLKGDGVMGASRVKAVEEREERESKGKCR